MKTVAHDTQAFVQARTRNSNIITQSDDIIDENCLGNIYGVARSSKPRARTIDEILEDSSDDDILESLFKKKKKHSICVETKKSNKCSDKGKYLFIYSLFISSFANITLFFLYIY